MRLYYFPGACSIVPHIALEETGAEYGLRKVDLDTDEQHSSGYLGINPAGQVPALEVDRGVITQVPAILGYLASAYPASGLASVDDPFEFAEM